MGTRVASNVLLNFFYLQKPVLSSKGRIIGVGKSMRIEKYFTNIFLSAA